MPNSISKGISPAEITGYYSRLIKFALLGEDDISKGSRDQLTQKLCYVPFKIFGKEIVAGHHLQPFPLRRRCRSQSRGTRLPVPSAAEIHVGSRLVEMSWCGLFPGRQGARIPGTFWQPVDPPPPRPSPDHRHQVWSLTQLYSIDFSQSKISVKVCFQQTHNQGFCQLLLTVSWDLRA